MNTSNIKKEMDDLFEKKLPIDSNNQTETLDEVDYYQWELSTGRKSELQQVHDLDFIEKRFTPDEYVEGIKVDLPATVLESLHNNNFIGIDASAGNIKQLYLACVFAQSAYGFFSYDQAFHQGKIYEEDNKYILFTNNIVKKGINLSDQNSPYKTKLLKHSELSKKGFLTRDDSISTAVTQIQAKLETKALNDIVLLQNYEKLNYCGIDGPLYNPLELQESIKGVKQAFDNSIHPYGITKRSNVSYYVECLKLHSDNDPFFKRVTKNWMGNDREFLGLHLKEGHRTPYFRHVTRYEYENGLPEDMYRICTYLRLPNHYIVRIELPSFLENEEQIEYLDEMVQMIYKMILMNNQKLPAHIDRADKIASITEIDRMKIRRVLEDHFREANLPFGDLDDYK